MNTNKWLVIYIEKTNIYLMNESWLATCACIYWLIKKSRKENLLYKGDAC